MKYVYSVYDRVSESWTDPVVARNDGEAMRGFMVSCSDPRIPDNYLHDISLYHIGQFDENSGLISSINPVVVCFGDSANVTDYRERVANHFKVGGNDNAISD